MLSDVADLVLGRACLACGSIGSELCSTCLSAVRGRALVRERPRPILVAAGPYSGFLGTAVLAYKQDGHRSLAEPLGLLLADAVATAARMARTETLTLVPVPGHRRPARGFDALAGIERAAVTHLRHRGLRVARHRALRLARDYRAAKGLGRVERQRQISGAFTARGWAVTGAVIVIDDVITTGATASEAVRALRDVGVAVTAVAAVAAAQPGYVGDVPRRRSAQVPDDAS